MTEIHIDPYDPIAQEWVRERVALLSDALRRLVDAVEFDTVDLGEALRAAKDLLR